MFASSAASTAWVCKVEARSGAGEERYEKGVRGRSNVGLGARCGLRLLCALVHGQLIVSAQGRVRSKACTVGEEGMAGVFTGGMLSTGYCISDGACALVDAMLGDACME